MIRWARTLVPTALLVVAAAAVFTAPAFAADEWLWNGAAIAAPLAVETTFELLLIDDNALVKADLLCGGLFVGTVGPGGADAVSTLLNSKSEAESALDLASKSFLSLKCELMEKGACEEANGTAITVFPLGLTPGWASEILLPIATLFVDDIKEGTGGMLPGFEVTCKTALLGVETDTCRGLIGEVLTNEGVGVKGVFEENEPETNPAGNCSIGGEKEGLVVGETLTVVKEVGTLSVS
jgi:hypothetical protein